MVACALGMFGGPVSVRAQEDNPAAAKITAPWVGTWGTAASSAAYDSSVSGSLYHGTNAFTEQTLRLIVHTSLGGRQVRVRLSNELSPTPVTIGAVHIAQSDAGAAIVPGTDRVVTFDGRGTVTIPAGGPAVSDAVKLDLPADGNLAVSIYLAGNVTVNTSHGGTQQTNYVSAPGSGDLTAGIALPVDPAVPTFGQWPLLTGVEVRSAGASTFVAFGSSITSGVGSTLNANHRWSDYLAQRLARQGIPVGVVNPSISANRLQLDSQGPSMLARFDRDVLSRPGVKSVLVTDSAGVDLIVGVSNPAQDPSTDDQIYALNQLITRAHSRGIKIYAGTILPLEGFPLETFASRAKRVAINQFIRSGAFDGVADFEEAVLDPADPYRILPALDSGDHHHPNDEGYRLMAKTVDLAWFQ